MKRLSLVILLLMTCLPALKAQQMSVEEFTRLSRPLWKRAAVPVDKTDALLDLLTPENGFTFLAGGQPVEAEEGEGVITLKLPHKTTYLTIKHPEFGQFTWRVPEGKKLRKRNHYQAFLLSGDPTKEYKAPKQWVVFRLNPENAIVQVDSLSRAVRKDVTEYYLPVGEHTYRVEAPFYEPQEGKFSLSDSLRADITVQLQPFYSFLTVKTGWQGGDLYIDGARIRKEDATSYRLGEGHHRVSFYWAEECFYDSLVYVGRAEKKVLELQEKDLMPRPIRLSASRSLDPPQDAGTLSAGTSVKLMAADADTEIWVDREKVGMGEWEGMLSPGYHLAQTIRGGGESTPTGLWIEEGFPQEVSLPATGLGSGLLNIHCNVDGARILINGADYGETPQIVRLDAFRSYKVTLSKPGYKEKMETVRPRGNHLVDVFIELKKKKL